jgi:hypothetical protein
MSDTRDQQLSQWLDREDAVPLYLGDDVTDWDAFRGASAGGVGILMADPADRELAGRCAAEHFLLGGIGEVENLLYVLAR